MWISACHFLTILRLILDIYFAKGIKWITDPLPVNKCKGQTANMTWEYIEEPGEEVTQLQWIFNRTELIAYFSLNQGFNVEPKYQGRVNQSGQTGILLHNISAKDSGDYTLYPLVKWEEKPNIRTVQLNVIETTVDPDCSCTELEVLPKMRNGQTFRIEVGSCKFEINSSVCCPVGLVYQYCVNDPSQICVPIRNFNVTESTTQNTAGSKEFGILLNQQSIIISFLVTISVGFCVINIMIFALIRIVRFYFKMIFRKLKKSRTSTLEDIHVPLSLLEQDNEHMSF